MYIYISRLRYDVSVRLSVTDVHCGHGACREEGGVISRYASQLLGPVV